jgi:hypothetical protein
MSGFEYKGYHVTIGEYGGGKTGWGVIAYSRGGEWRKIKNIESCSKCLREHYFEVERPGKEISDIGNPGVRNSLRTIVKSLIKKDIDKHLKSKHA